MGKRMKKFKEQIIFERRVLFFCTIFLFLAFILWLVSISTSYWFIINGDKGIYVPKTKRYFINSHSGIWKVCRYTYVNGTLAEEKGGARNASGTLEKSSFGYFDCNCTFEEMGKLKKGPSLDIHVLNYNRAEAVFSVIAIILMVLGFSFSCYTFKNPRYMFKRTAGALHFLSAGASFTVIELVMHSVEYESKHVPYSYPPGATHTYGYSFALAWLVFIVNLVAGCAFMIFSRKRKGKKAPNEELGMADEPAIIGR